MKKLLLLALITVSSCYASEEHRAQPVSRPDSNNNNNNETSIAHEEAHFYSRTIRVLALHEKIKNREQLTDEDKELLLMVGRVVMNRAAASR